MIDIKAAFPPYSVVPRHVAWTKRLTEFLTKMQQDNYDGLISFNWDPTVPNSYNCLTFGSAVVDMVLGVDLYDRFGGNKHYTDALSAYRVMKELGYDSMVGLLSSLFQEIPIGFATRGDLLLVPGTADVGDGAFDYAVAVADSPHFFCVTEGGFSKGHYLQAYRAGYKVKAFKVGA